MATRDYVVDVAVYQSTSMSAYKQAGARQVIVKLTEGTGYFNPKASTQIKSTHANQMYLHAYHFATFGSSISRAKAEAKFFVARAKKLNVSKKRYLWLDWETGDGNSVVDSKAANTRAILAFMNVCHNAGYKVGLYSSASLLRGNVNTHEVVKKYGTCLWVASYATMGRIDTPNFSYFPSMNGVAIWQFTDNWYGLNVDGNITLKKLIADTAKAPAKKVVAKPKPKPKTPSTAYVPVISNNPNYKVRLLDSKGHYQKYINTNTNWKVWAEKTIRGMMCYKIGNDQQWVPAKFCKKIE
ncbi:GH25 family lysozyme [Lactobacillus kefiranofaciens]|uniref:GH25 family lysozyme n=1 Tax=Lactobacillus kefiranofaciens TaxID=267818 RepID=UPI002468AD34|nr:GH25 family lysozyme [Lactobacillus kefiranofaciens]MDH5099737.1 GH25 family lysozyme [Lactobacillus kefiranofaciens]